MIDAALQIWYVRGPSSPPTPSHLWHVESPGVDQMLCGVSISLDEGEVRRKPGKNVCPDCEKTLKERPL